jgi:ribosomal protein S18 acetylase RimI-like enzyme
VTDRSVISLVPYTQGAPLLETALEVYTRVWPERDRDDAREGFTRYAGYDDFHGIVALRGATPVGVGYGARSSPGVPWHDLVSAELGGDHPALQDAWRLVELAVVAEARQCGVGGRIHDALLAARHCSRALLSTAVANQRARAMYERRGWHYVVEAFQPAGEPHPYVIMGRELPT